MSCRSTAFMLPVLLAVAACQGDGTGTTQTPINAGHVNTQLTGSGGSIVGFLNGFRPNGSDSSATPIVGATIVVRLVTGNGGPSQRTIQHGGCNRASDVVTTVTTSSTGSFSATGLASGTYDLIMTPPTGSGYFTTAFCQAEVTANAGLDLRIYLLRTQ